MPSYEEIATATPWIGENVGDRVSGNVVGYTVFEHEEYGKSPVVILDTESGLIKVYAIHGVLLDGIKSANAQLGEKLTVVSQGRIKSRKRKDPRTNEPVEYWSYLVYKGDGDTSVFETVPDWSEFESKLK